MKNATDAELIGSVKKLAFDERRIGIEILHLLREIQARGLHLERGYSSLFSFCVGELKYSEVGAFQKIQALKLMTEVPEIEAKLESGELSLANAALVQSFTQNARKKKIEIPSQTELVRQVENQSRREAERTLARIAPEVVSQADKIRPISDGSLEIRFVASDRLLKKLEKLKALRSHVQANPALAELLEDLADMALAKLDPEAKTERDQKPEKSKNSKKPKEPGKSENPEKSENPAESERSEKPKEPAKTDCDAPSLPWESKNPDPNFREFKPLRRPIPASVKRLVWRRDKGRCTFIDSKSQKRCESQTLLEIDHRIPVALSGTNDPDNLRLYCAQHNSHAADRIFGPRFMARFKSSPK